MNEETKNVKISVRNLVEFILRFGDITGGGSGIRNLDAMQEGSRIHRKIQASMGIGYEAEVPLFACVPMRSVETGDEFMLTVEGRADGVFRDDEVVLIDEIKGVYKDLDDMEQPDPIHLAQAKCYAYMVATDEALDSIDVQITYCNMDTERIKRFKETISSDEIKKWFDELIEKYKPWAIYEYDWAIKRAASIKKMDFPFPFRPGQDDLTAFTYQKIREKKRLFIEAPTGVGKTITTVFPSIKAMGEGLIDRIFYLTAKTITRTVAQDCFSLLKKSIGDDAAFKPITLTAKEKLCILDKPACDPATCERAKGHYDRVNDALYDLLTHEDGISRETVISYADKHNVCPFELSLDAALYADAVIGDYNYVFDPNVYLRRFFTPQKQGHMVLLIDEAHNLVERGREMYSATIVKEDFLAVNRVAKAMLKKEHRPDAIYSLRQFINSVESVNRALLELKRGCESGFKEVEDFSSIGFKLLRVVANYELMAAENPVLPERDLFLEFYFNVRRALMVWEEYDDHYLTYENFDEEGNFRVTLQCMDPSTRLREVCDRARSGIFFSATLLPIRYYKEQLGGDSEDDAVYAKSSFTDDQKKILIANDVTSLYKSRGPKMYERIAAYIEHFVSAKKGNYLVFFPSYRFMEEVAALITLPDDITLLTQGRKMRESEREDFLSAFDSDNVVGLCVMGGIFSEGIDLTGDKLIGAAIVGTGLPMVCDERELFRKYFDEKKGHGFDYAYLYPGLGKVFQAGGRVIRTAEDRGVILLLDERFLRREYMKEFPREWSSFDTVTIDTLDEHLNAFWSAGS